MKNLNDSNKNGKISLRSAKAEVNLNISVGSISTILKKDLKLHPYKPISATLLTPQHKGQRKQFCEFILNEYANDPTFHYKIIFTDETQQDLNPCINHKNNRRWSSSQPYDYEELTAQGPKAMAWSGINWHLGVIGTYWIDGNLNSNSYNILLHIVVSDLNATLNNRDDLPFQLSDLIFQQDGSTSHTTIINRQFLESQFS